MIVFQSTCTFFETLLTQLGYYLIKLNFRVAVIRKTIIIEIEIDEHAI